MVRVKDGCFYTKSASINIWAYIFRAILKPESIGYRYLSETGHISIIIGVKSVSHINRSSIFLVLIVANPLRGIGWPLKATRPLDIPPSYIWVSLSV
jgi:hypothetical protein